MVGLGTEFLPYRLPARKKDLNVRNTFLPISFHVYLFFIFQVQAEGEEASELIIINKPGDDVANDCDDDEYVTAALIEEDSDDLYCWALVVEQVIW